MRCETAADTDVFTEPSVLLNSLLIAHYGFLEKGKVPKRISMKKVYVLALYRHLIHEPDLNWDPKDGEQCGEFMGVALFVDESEEVFSYIGEL